MVQNIILLSATQYRITDEKTGAVNDGCTLRYIMAENLEPRFDKRKSTKGFVPAKSTISYSDFDKLEIVPGCYEVEFDCNIAADGKVSLKPMGFKFLGGVSVNKIVANK